MKYNSNNFKNKVNLLIAFTQRRGFWFTMILLLGLMAFEIWNFVSSQGGLLDILGERTFAGMRWASLLAFAFCSIDFAGIARIFTPEQGRDEPAEIWYLFGAWFLAAMFDSILTYWTVKVAILTNPVGSVMIANDPKTINIVSVGIAVIDFSIRMLLINTFATAGERLFSTESVPSHSSPRSSSQNVRSQTNNNPYRNYPQPISKQAHSVNYSRPIPSSIPRAYSRNMKDTETND
jgi:hypothetical protein